MGVRIPHPPLTTFWRVGRVAYGAALLTRKTPDGVAEVRILHPPLSSESSLTSEDADSNKAVIAHAVERPVVNRRKRVQTPLAALAPSPGGGGGRTWT